MLIYQDEIEIIRDTVLYGFDKGKVILNSKEIGEKVQIDVYNGSRLCWQKLMDS